MYKEDPERKFQDDTAAQIAIASYNSISQDVILYEWDLGIPDEPSWRMEEDSATKHGPGKRSFLAKDTKSGSVFRIIQTLDQTDS
jgi:hypothetical protein